MNDYFKIKFTGVIGNAIETSRTAEGRTFAKFMITPPDQLNGNHAVSCIAFNTRAEILERFVSRGDLIEISGSIGPAEYITETGEQIHENNIIEVTGISFPESNNEIGTEAETA